MELKYLVMRSYDDYMEELFSFTKAELAMEVSQQLKDKQPYNNYEVVVRYA